MTTTGITAPTFNGDPTFTVPVGHEHSDVMVWGNGNVQCEVCDAHLGVSGTFQLASWELEQLDIEDSIVQGPWVNPAIGSYF